MSNKEDQRYLDACKIVDSYERGMRSSQSKASVLIGLDSTVSAMEEIVKAAELSMVGMKNPTGKETGIQKESTSEKQESKSSNSCDDEEKPFINYEGGGTVSFNSEVKSDDVFQSAEDGINEFLGTEISSEALRNGLSDCYDCNLRASFDFQIRPINLLSEIMPLINKLSNTIDMLLNELRPTNLLKSICDLSVNFRFWCLQDILNVIIALTGLTKRYMGQFIKIALNWTAIIGPIIKLIVDIAVKFMEQIRRMIIAPLDCASGVLSTAISFQESVATNIDELKAFAAVFPNEESWDRTGNVSEVKRMQGFAHTWDGAKTSLIGGEAKIPYQWEYNSQDSLESAFEKEKARLVRERKLKQEQRRIEKINRKLGKYIEEELEGTIYSEESEQALTEELKRIEKQESGSMLRNLLFAINSSKQWVNEMFANLLLAVKSLNGLISGSLELSIKLGTWMLMIFDLVKVIQVIVSLVQSGGLKNICKDLEEDPEKVNFLLERYLDENDYNLAKDFQSELKRFDEMIFSLEDEKQNSCV